MIQAASLADASTPAWREPLAQFQAFTIAHPHLVAAKDSLIAAIRESEPNSIVMVWGPLVRLVESSMLPRAGCTQRNSSLIECTG